MKPSLAHSPSWVCRLRGVIWRRSASSRPLQSRWGSVVIRAVTRCRRVCGGGGRGRAGVVGARWGLPGLGWRGGGGGGVASAGVAAGGGGGGPRPGGGGGGGGAAVVPVEVAGCGAFGLGGAVAGAPRGQQGGQDGAADGAGQVGRAVGAYAAGCGEFLRGRLQGRW